MQRAVRMARILHKVAPQISELASGAEGIELQAGDRVIAVPKEQASN